MKKSIFVLATISFVLALFSGISNADSGISSIYVSTAKYEPFPAEPGQFLDVWLKVENLGGGTSGEVLLEIMPAYPFSLESGDALKTVGAVPSGSAILIKYRLKIDEMATSGDNILKIKYKSGPTSSWVTKDIEISIQAHDAILSVAELSSDELVPGKIQTVTLSLENLANTYLKDIGASFDFSATTLPFATVDSVNEKRIASIQSKGKGIVSFQIITNPDAVSGVYKVPITLKYSDITNKNYTRQYLIGFVVNSKPDFDLVIQKYDSTTLNSVGTITLGLSNTGPGAIKFMTMEILPSDNYEIIGENSIYLGNLDPDDYETGVFKIYVKSIPESSKTVPLKVALKYRDGLNNYYSSEEVLNMRIYTPEEISAYGLMPTSSTNTTIYAIIGLIVIYYAYKKFFKKSKQH